MTKSKVMELPILFAQIDREGHVSFDHFCGVRHRRKNVMQFKSRRNFVKAMMHPKDGDIESVEYDEKEHANYPFFKSIRGMKNNDNTYTILSLEKSGLNHAIPLLFSKKKNIVRVYVTDIRGSKWPRLSGYYQPRSIVAALRHFFKQYNLLARFHGRPDILIRTRVVGPVQNKWTDYLIPGNEYHTKFPNKYIPTMDVVNCRAAALSFVYLYMHGKHNRVRALAKLKKIHNKN